MENHHMSIKSHYEELDYEAIFASSLEFDYEGFDYDMVFVTQFYDGKLWVVWKEAVTGNTLTSEFEEIGYKPEYPVA
jgi:hypothetical protein